MSEVVGKSTAARALWTPAEDVTARGTVVLLPGRGEHPGLYARLGTRLAFDGYRVVAVASGDDVADELRGGPVPVVLLGSDTGAITAVTLAAQLPVHAVVAAGLPLTAEHTADRSWEGELDARTACPAHRTGSRNLLINNAGNTDHGIDPNGGGAATRFPAVVVLPGW